MNADIKAIEAATQTYLDGMYEGSVEKLESVFHPTSALTHISDGQLKILPRAEWMQLVRERQSPQSRNLERKDEILSIDVVDPRTAIVKVKCQVPPRYFVDLLNFLKIDGRWQVAQKVFAAETRE